MIKLFTHNDLDGIGCALLAALHYGIDNIDFETCKYDDINQKVLEYFETKSYLNFERCFITDISISTETANFIVSYQDPENIEFCSLKHIKLLDHHISALELNAFSFCSVQTTYEDGHKTSGTSLFFDYLKTAFPKNSQLHSSFVQTFVEKIRLYDTWEWADTEDLDAKHLNNLYYILGRDYFFDNWLKRLLNPSSIFGFTETEKLLLELNQNEIDKYIEARNEDLIVKEILGYQAGIVFANRFQSELGNKLAELHPELDFIAMINIGGGVSCRTIKDHINLANDIASFFGGGGHPKASGFPVPAEIREMVINTLFSIDED